jgi:hypothetical protein
LNTACEPPDGESGGFFTLDGTLFTKLVNLAYSLGMTVGVSLYPYRNRRKVTLFADGRAVYTGVDYKHLMKWLEQEWLPMLSPADFQ